jgi:hypothetical protein
MFGGCCDLTDVIPIPRLFFGFSNAFSILDAAAGGVIGERRELANGFA